MMSSKKPNLDITPQKLIVNLLNSDKERYFVDIEEIFGLFDFIIEKLKEIDLIKEFGSISVDVNFDAIRRTVICSQRKFELIGERIFLLRELSEDEINFNKFPQKIQSFVDEFIKAA